METDMLNVMPYRVVPDLNQYNLMIFLLNWGRGCFAGYTLGAAFASEFEYVSDNHSRFIAEQDILITLRHIEKLMKEIT
jgi:hypothetical protein